MKLLLFPIFIFAFTIFVSACNEEVRFCTAYFLKHDTSKSQTLNLEIAHTTSMRNVGLMYRNFLPLNNGMLFIFPGYQKRSFWMKNTRIPLDIIFLNEKKKIINIARNAVPYSDTSVVSESESSYVVELNAGLAASMNLAAGDSLIVNDKLPEAK